MEKLDVIVVDDARDDILTDLIRRQFPIVRLIRNPVSSGADGSKQAGIDAAIGEIIAHTDADCTVNPHWARVIVKSLADGAGVVTGPVRHSDSLLGELVGIADFQDFQGDRCRWVNIFPGCNFATRRDVLLKLGYRTRDLRFGSDRLISWRMHTNGLRIWYDPAMEVHHSPSVNLASLLERRFRYGRKALTLRKIDPTLPGSAITRLGPFAAPAYIGYKVVKDVGKLLSIACHRHVNPWHIPALALGLLLFRLLDAGGMIGVGRVHPRTESPARIPSPTG